MSKGRYRNRIDIIADMLYSTGESARKTKIMFGANLSFSSFNRYLAEVVKADLISINGDGRSYSLTERGKEFLKRYTAYSELRKKAEDQTSFVEAVRVDLENLCLSDAADSIRPRDAHR